jgi:hypothetical protein
MSWSFSAIGAPRAVAAKAQDAIDNGYKCLEPEETIRLSALGMIVEACENGFSDQYAVQVTASGSQSVIYGQVPNAPPTVESNQLNLQIMPIYGFVTE